TSRISKTEKGANRRGIIISILGTLRRRLQDFSLDSILKCIFESYQLGISLFSIIKPPETQ
ncbi:MAG: hypothetical protein LBQ50_12125, partial [Planctomycetaceae bacterium]|nr:hypothetical protein [Planctomycetaceae bacterium]